MANMSYCRFQNTLGDLHDCREALGELLNLAELGDEEEKAARRLIKLCRRIAEDWDEDA